MYLTLTTHTEKCSGCRLCELVCSIKHENISNPQKARLRIVEEWPEDEISYCRQCQDAACAKICPSAAIKRNHIGALIVDETLCNGCGNCVDACPYNAMFLNLERAIAFKCDLCAGDPVCVKFCLAGAIELGRW